MAGDMNAQLLLSVLVFIMGSSHAIGLTGQGVCSRSVTVTDYYWKVVTYRCCTTTSYWSGGSRRYSSDYGTCTKRQRLCGPVTKTEAYCCSGYEENLIGGCNRIDQCNSNNGNCEHMCRSDGIDYKCTCFNGYMVDSSDRYKCTDTDECSLLNGKCNQDCSNTPGGYYCSCQNGYGLESPHKCTEINECETFNGGCPHNCTNTIGAFYCTCEPGYMLREGFYCDEEAIQGEPLVASQSKTMMVTATALGAAVGGLLIIALIILGICLVRRRPQTVAAARRILGRQTARPASYLDPEATFIAAKKELALERNQYDNAKTSGTSFKKAPMPLPAYTKPTLSMKSPPGHVQDAVYDNEPPPPGYSEPYDDLTTEAYYTNILPPSVKGDYDNADTEMGSYENVLKMNKQSMSADLDPESDQDIYEDVETAKEQEKKVTKQPNKPAQGVTNPAYSSDELLQTILNGKKGLNSTA